MHHDQRGVGAELDGEIAIGDGVERVFADPFEAEFPGDELPVDRKGGAGQRCRPQRQPIHPFAAAGQA